MSYYNRKYIDFEELKGVVLSKVEQQGDDEIHFHSADGRHFKLWHRQDCCESVYIESIVGDLQDLVGTPITLAEEVVSNDEEAYESGTWTFYKLATVKGYVDIRWHGESNGYYSESVDFVELVGDDNF